ncbi:hypothetical protein [Ruminiclostridium papyrosolvens]|uniref:Uncharacterized protein n=1 Tax=Ruminiclostridium papyrosolvens C7 TaxID=1330534 RepID=U4R739_9FIRM|nr:hypothetical protein [Ruminiclostridium papyrosolvens]EPR14065.1 hypothetical protein L323_01615 [Ruminiclostridium papyrosolvens C7]
MFKVKNSVRILAITVAAATVITSSVNLPVSAKSYVPVSLGGSVTKFTPVTERVTLQKEINYFASGDSRIPTDGWVTTNTDQSAGITAGLIGSNVKVTLKSIDNNGNEVLWIGTDKGLMRVCMAEPDTDDVVQYFNGPRYLFNGDDVVTALKDDGSYGVWVKNAAGAVHIKMVPRSLTEKDAVYQQMGPVTDIRGAINDSNVHLYDNGNDTSDGAHPAGSVPTDTNSDQLTTVNGRVFAQDSPYSTNNDGLWTALRFAGDAYKYAYLKQSGMSDAEPMVIETRENAMRMLSNILLQGYISGRGDGFITRQYHATYQQEYFKNGNQTTDPDSAKRTYDINMYKDPLGLNTFNDNIGDVAFWKKDINPDGTITPNSKSYIAPRNKIRDSKTGVFNEFNGVDYPTDGIGFSWAAGGLMSTTDGKYQMTPDAIEKHDAYWKTFSGNYIVKEVAADNTYTFVDSGISDKSKRPAGAIRIPYLYLQLACDPVTGIPDNSYKVDAKGVVSGGVTNGPIMAPNNDAIPDVSKVPAHMMPRVVFQLESQIKEEVPAVLAKLYRENDIYHGDKFKSAKDNEIVYKTDTSSEEVVAAFFSYYIADKFLFASMDNMTADETEIQRLMVQSCMRQMKNIVLNKGYFMGDENGRPTLWAKWYVTWYADNINEGVGVGSQNFAQAVETEPYTDKVDSSITPSGKKPIPKDLTIDEVKNKQITNKPLTDGVDNLYSDGRSLDPSYAYEDAPLQAAEVMMFIRVAQEIAKDYSGIVADLNSNHNLGVNVSDIDAAWEAAFKPYDYSAVVSEAAKGADADFSELNGVGYIEILKTYFERKLTQNMADWGMSTVADWNNKTKKEYWFQKAWVQDCYSPYVNGSDQELAYLSYLPLLLLEKQGTTRGDAIREGFEQWFDYMKTSETPAYLFLAQVANPDRTDIDLNGAMRQLYRLPQYLLSYPSYQSGRNDIYTHVVGSRNWNLLYSNIALPFDERSVMKINNDPLSVDTNVTFNGNLLLSTGLNPDYTIKNYNWANDYNFTGGKGYLYDYAPTFTMPYWFGKYFGLIQGTAPESGITKYTYDKVLTDFSDTGSQGFVKQYIKFLQDPTYTPSNNLTEISSILTNAQTFVNKDFTIKPSIFPTLENVSSSVLKSDRKTLWLGYTAGGVDRINLENNEVTSYSAASIGSGKVLLVVDDADSNGVWVITTDGVTKIKQ